MSSSRRKRGGLKKVLENFQRCNKLDETRKEKLQPGIDEIKKRLKEH